MQRVAVARALMMDPPLILADEPTGNLDTKTGAAIMALLTDIAHQHDRSVVMVTHNLDAASSTDRVITLTDGRIGSDVLAGRRADMIVDRMRCVQSARVAQTPRSHRDVACWWLLSRRPSSSRCSASQGRSRDPLTGSSPESAGTRVWKFPASPTPASRSRSDSMWRRCPAWRRRCRCCERPSGRRPSVWCCSASTRASVPC